MNPKKELSTLLSLTFVSAIILLVTVIFVTPSYTLPTLQFFSEQAATPPETQASKIQHDIVPTTKENTDIPKNNSNSTTTTSTTTTDVEIITSSSKTEGDGTATNTEDSGSSGSTGSKNINQATTEDLMNVKGIGEKKAAAILDYLADTGGISNMDSLLDISGIGDKTLQELKLHFYAE